ncbi:heterodisulfide reductase-related iron-sulfur binding cluster [Streptomyces sp. JHA26]|uniref:heterodisulfide reductase-related iron-sulfur binding cluster n=1 Tax=Streptomyces sp. JHA26 TaxID=1917143 RepID=UPI000989EC31
MAIATVKVLERLGVEVDFPAARTCCGRPPYDTGYAAPTTPSTPPCPTPPPCAAPATTSARSPSTSPKSSSTYGRRRPTRAARGTGWRGPR